MHSCKLSIKARVYFLLSRFSSANHQYFHRLFSLFLQEAEAQRAELRIAKTAIANVSLWFICWTPYAAITVQVCTDLHQYMRAYLDLPSLLAALEGTVARM